MRKKILRAVFGALVAGAGFLQAAAAAYPERPVRIVLPYSAGGGGDVAIRMFQSGMEKRLGQSVIIDYRPGAAGNIGMAEVAKAAPDGYTLVVGPTNNFVINQYLFHAMGFDPLTAFAPVSMLIENPYFITVGAKVPAHTLKEFGAFAHAQRGKLNFGSPGTATVPHLSGLMISEHFDAGMVHVPYKGSRPGLQALIAGDVQMFIASYGIIAGPLKAGTLRALAVSGHDRLKPLPNVPTAAEAGLPDGLLYSNWWAVAAPRGTDAAIVERLARDFRAVAADPDIQKKFIDQGAIVIANTPAEAGKRMHSEAKAWKAIIAKTGVKLDN